jgi:hypothetical protein
METNPFSVDRAYVVSVRALKKVLAKISSPASKWWVEEVREKSAVVAQDRQPESLVPGMEVITFSFPKIADISLFPDREEGEILCLYPLARIAEKPGLYLQGNRLLADDFRDWEPFWRPVERELAECRAAALFGDPIV